LVRMSEMPEKSVLNASGVVLGKVLACVTEPYARGILGYKCQGSGLQPGIFYVRQDQIAYISDRYLGLKPGFQEDKEFGKSGNFSPLGLTVYSARGGAFGRVGDIAFSEETGRFQSVTLSDGLIKDLLFGRRHVQLNDAASLKPHGLMLSGPVELSEENSGGLLKHLESRG